MIRPPGNPRDGGHASQGFFWPILKKGTKATGPALGAIARKFGSFYKFKKDFSNCAALLFGSGWAWLAMNTGELEIVTTPNQDSPLDQGKRPILGIDVREPAYYADVANCRSLSMMVSPTANGNPSSEHSA